MHPEVCMDDIPPPILRRQNVELYRKKGIRIYSVLFVSQLIVGLGCLACAIVATQFGASKVGIPYYTGGLMIAALMLFSSLLAFRIYNKGPAFSVDEAAKKDVTCALNCHHTCSFLLFFGTVVGLAILWMYGLCVGSEDASCSYGTVHVTENRIVAGTNLFLGACALVTSGVGVCLIRKYGRAFGIEHTARRSLGAHNDNTHGLRRTSRMQNVFSLPQSSGFNSAFQNADGYTNYGFEPPYPLPPYTSTIAHAHDSHVIAGIPTEPPPPYSEFDPTDDTRVELNTHL